MSSIHLPSFFHNRSSSKKETTSLLSKRSTSSFKTQHEEDIPSLHRSSTTLSKVKRFGSLLSRNKKNDDSSSVRRRVDTIFPPNIDTTLSTSTYSLSALSTNTNISSDEDDLITPTTTYSPPNNALFKDEMKMFNVVMPDVKQNCEPIEIMSVTPQDQTNHISAEEDITAPIEESICPIVDKQIDPMALSSLVQFYLSAAIDEADVEIECELQVCHAQMLHSIRAMPAYSF